MNKVLAPIVLFVYHRPEHTRHILQALSENWLAPQSLLYVYADGPKPGADAAMLQQISAVKDVVLERNWCREVRLLASATNLGCAKSVAAGVTEVVHKHGKVIVLEDDILTSPAFLTFMNDALDRFESDTRIGSVNGYADTLEGLDRFPPYFLLSGADCWGWATWSNRWSSYIPDARKLLDLLRAHKLERKFDYGGYFGLLQQQMEGTIDSWDILWHGSQVLAGSKGLYVNTTFVLNIGTDGSGTHGDHEAPPPVPRLLNTYSTTVADISVEALFAAHPSVEKQYRKLRHRRRYAYRTPMHYLKTVIKALTGLDRAALDRLLRRTPRS